jgi:hypothetical protein
MNATTNTDTRTRARVAWPVATAGLTLIAIAVAVATACGNQLTRGQPYSPALSTATANPAAPDRSPHAPSGPIPMPPVDQAGERTVVTGMVVLPAANKPCVQLQTDSHQNFLLMGHLADQLTMGNVGQHDDVHVRMRLYGIIGRGDLPTACKGTGRPFIADDGIVLHENN